MGGKLSSAFANLDSQTEAMVGTGAISLHAKVGEVPTFRASDTDTDLPTVSTDLFSGFQYLKHRFIASKRKFISDTIASSHKKIPFMLKYRFKASKSSVSTNTIACVG
jgi:hypothetical protein